MWRQGDVRTLGPMRRLTLVLAVLGATTILVLAANTVTLAATGQGFLLGKSNGANNITALTRTTSGTVLKLQSLSPTNPPLAVNGTGKVANLNADRLDGLDATALQHRSYVYTVDVSVPTTAMLHEIPVPVGTYAFSYSAFLNTTDTGDVGCEIRREHSGSTTYFGITTFTETSGGDPGISAAGVVTKTTGDTVLLYCAGSSFTTTAAAPIQVVFSPTTVVGGGSLN